MSRHDPFYGETAVYREFGPGIIAEAEYRARQARHDAERDIAMDRGCVMTSPRDVAFHLPLWAVEALTRAILSNDPRHGGCLRVHYDVTPEQRRELALCGLVEIKGPYLTAFGSKVRKVLREERA